MTDVWDDGVSYLRSIYLYYKASRARIVLIGFRKLVYKYLRKYFVSEVELQSVTKFRVEAKHDKNAQLFVLGDSILCEGRRGNLYSAGKYVVGSDDGLARIRNRNASMSPVRAGPPFVLSLHGPHATNYYHFFIHTLTKVVIAESVLESNAFPILVDAGLAKMPFYQDAVSLGFFEGHELIEQKEDEAFDLQQVAIVKPGHFPYHYLDMVLDRFEIGGVGEVHDRVYIARGSKSNNSRLVSNFEEICAILEAHSFAIVDPQQYSLIEQMRVFSKAGHVVSPHGAGLTNIIFRRGADMSVYEIFPDNLQNKAYEWLCRNYGFNYQGALMAKCVGGPTMGTTEIDGRALQLYLKGIC